VGVRSGLAAVQAGVGTLIAYATEPDNVSYDGGSAHSPFTGSLLAHIGTPGLEVRQLMTRVRNDVIAVTDRAQVPWDHSSLVGDFYFVPPTAEAAVPALAATDEQRYWDAAQDLASPERKIPALEAYLARYPEGAFATLARLQLDELAAGSGRETAMAAARPLTLPAPERPEAAVERALGLDRAARRAVQHRLLALGFDPGGTDARVGPRTRGAIAAFQRRHGLPATGYLDAATMARLEEAAVKLSAEAPPPLGTVEVAAPQPQDRAPAPSAAGIEPSAQVLCRMPGDPEWLEARLIMRFQCERAGGAWRLP
jgi:hypothetical protein